MGGAPGNLGSCWQEPFCQRVHSISWLHETFYFFFFYFFLKYYFFFLLFSCEYSNVFVFFFSILFDWRVFCYLSRFLSFFHRSSSFFGLLVLVALLSLFPQVAGIFDKMAWFITASFQNDGKTWLRLESSYTPTFIEFRLKNRTITMTKGWCVGSTWQHITCSLSVSFFIFYSNSFCVSKN